MLGIKEKRPQKKGINLLRESTTPKTFWEKFYVWALTIGRFIIVGTEAIVLAVWIARYKLDRDINDVNDSLEIKAAILESMSETEVNAANLQNLLYKIRTVYEAQPLKSANFKALNKMQVNGVEITNFKIKNSEITISATAKDLNAFTLFEETFKANTSLLSNIIIPSAEKEEVKGETVYKISLTATIKETEEENE